MIAADPDQKTAGAEALDAGIVAATLAAPRAKAAERNTNLEILRIVAAFGIVAYHAQVPFKEVPYAGLIAFLALSPLVDARFNWTRIRSIVSLANVFLLPWVFWFVIYAAANVVMNKPALPEGNSVASVLYGSAPHLWFLPLIFVVLAALGQIKRVCSPVVVFWIAIAAGSLVLATAIAWHPQTMAAPAPYAQWIHGSAAILAGLALGLYRATIKGAWGGIVVLSAALLICSTYWLPGMSLTYAIGLVGVGLALFSREPFAAYGKAIRAVSQCMFGVYLVHILAIAIVKKVVPVDNYAVALVIFMLCLAGVALIRRILPQTRLVLG